MSVPVGQRESRLVTVLAGQRESRLVSVLVGQKARLPSSLLSVLVGERALERKRRIKNIHLHSHLYLPNI